MDRQSNAVCDFAPIKNGDKAMVGYRAVNIEGNFIMVKKIMMTLFLTSFLIVGGISAMESPGPQAFQKTKKMSPSEEENAKKMMLLKEHMKNMGADQPDVHGHIGEALHAVSSNPVLNATLEYTNLQTKENVSFKIGTKVKDGMIDLSDKAFGDVAKYLVITTDPRAFFADTHKNKLLILIAPWSLIHDNLSSPSCAPFQPIMKDWNEKIAPIGIFWRDGNWDNKSWYHYQIKFTMEQITQKTLYTVYANVQQSPTRPTSVRFRAILSNEPPNFKVKF